MAEVVRVLRPGGVAYFSIHPYTSQSGCLDPRVFTDRWREVEDWPHLRPQMKGKIDGPNVFLNKLRLKQWKELFTSRMESAQFTLIPGHESAVETAKKLQSQGELLEYSIEELTVGELIVIWKKPAGHVRP